MRSFARFDTIWYQFKKHEKHPWRGNTFSKVAAEACNFTKSNTPPWVFVTFSKIVQMVPNRAKHHKYSLLGNTVFSFFCFVFDLRQYDRF